MEKTTMQKKAVRQADSKPNITGIPMQMKRDFERGSGQPFDDVRVHYNSKKPAQLGALAYTQGTQVYIGPGQERYLPHELGHVVQQKAGLVRPTRLENGLRFNDDPTLERQADQIMEWGRIRPLSLGPDAVIQRAPDPAGVGIELETEQITINIPNPPSDSATKQETAWKGKHLEEYVTRDQVQWAITIDTTPFCPESGRWSFNLEIVVDGRTLILNLDENVMRAVGEDIKETLRGSVLLNMPQINGCTLEKMGELVDSTVFSVQVTCAMPLYKAYDLLDKEEPSSILNPNSTYSLSDDLPYDLVFKNREDIGKKLSLDELEQYVKDGRISFHRKKRPEADKEIHVFLLLLAEAFGEAHDPKQNMPLMPRTSLGKIFMMLTEAQRETILTILDHPNSDTTALCKINLVTADAEKRAIGDSAKVLFNDYKAYLQGLHTGLAKTEEDPIANHPEPLGIGKLGDRTEVNLFTRQECPIFEFRRIGSCTLATLPDSLGKINDELIKNLRTDIMPPSL